jgi:hypothetical protein
LSAAKKKETIVEAMRKMTRVPRPFTSFVIGALALSAVAEARDQAERGA